jgi:ABC-type phosphate/phosphonate transport system substrate-binding protein
MRGDCDERGDGPMIASAWMYEWAPSLIVAWRRLLAWVAGRAAVELEMPDRGAQSLEDLWGRPDMGCVFMCGYPYALQERRPALLAAPVPSPPRYGGQPVYVSDFVVRADSGFQRLSDTFGERIAYSTEHSHSGYNAPRFHLLRHRRHGSSSLFKEAKGPYGRQRAVIQAVLDGEAEVTAIDGYAFDLLRRHDPAVAQLLRVVDTTEPAPSPPLVASPALPPTARARLTAALLAAHEAAEMAPVLADLLLLRFAPVEEATFEVFLDRERASAAAGYPRLG